MRRHQFLRQEPPPIRYDHAPVPPAIRSWQLPRHYHQLLAESPVQLDGQCCHPLEVMFGEVLLVNGAEEGKEGATIFTKTLDFVGGTLGVYFASHTSASCKEFNKILSEFCKRQRTTSHKFEVVLVSVDTTEDHFRQTSRSTPGLALLYREEEKRRQLMSDFRVTSLPTLVLMEVRSQKVITWDGVGVVMAETGQSVDEMSCLPDRPITTAHVRQTETKQNGVLVANTAYVDKLGAPMSEVAKPDTLSSGDNVDVCINNESSRHWCQTDLGNSRIPRTSRDKCEQQIANPLTPIAWSPSTLKNYLHHTSCFQHDMENGWVSPSLRGSLRKGGLHHSGLVQPIVDVNEPRKPHTNSRFPNNSAQNVTSSNMQNSFAQPWMNKGDTSSGRSPQDPKPIVPGHTLIKPVAKIPKFEEEIVSKAAKNGSKPGSTFEGHVDRPVTSNPSPVVHMNEVTFRPMSQHYIPGRDGRDNTNPKADSWSAGKNDDILEDLRSPTSEEVAKVMRPPPVRLIDLSRKVKVQGHTVQRSICFHQAGPRSLRSSSGHHQLV